MRGKVLELTGQKFGRLTVIRREGVNKFGVNMWLCECECGGTAIVQGYNLTSGRTRSCGCNKGHRSHGMTHSREYREWKGIKTRCYNTQESCYDLYGGRGINVCDEWRNDFMAFYDYISELPHFREPNRSLDRINNDGNYEPGNVRWADQIMQNNNKRNNITITYQGETHTLTEWSRMVGISPDALRYRLTHGWSVERAFTTPSQRPRY